MCVFLPSFRDREDKLLATLWPGLKRHLRRSSADLVLHYLHLLNYGTTKSSSKQSSSYSTYKWAL